MQKRPARHARPRSEVAQEIAAHGGRNKGLRADRIRTAVSSKPDARAAVRELAAELRQPETELVIFFCSPEYDLESVRAAFADYLPGIKSIGCTSAGEITPLGYHEGCITGASFPRAGFRTVSARIDGLSHFQMAEVREQVRALRLGLEGVIERTASHWIGGNTFAFLLIDGLSRNEERIVSAFNDELGPITLFGGSAGDGYAFRRTHVYHEGRFRTDAAVLTLVHTPHPFRVFKTDHFVPTDRKMVVTGADSERRVVTEINAEPAAQEYARLVGVDRRELTPRVFAAHPLVVRVGGEYHVRAIQQVNEDDSLSFFCAIDEGLVLTLARGEDMLSRLDRTFRNLSAQIGAPQLVVGCDCVLRKLEIEQRQIGRQMSELLRRHRVVGFATYGEQYNAMHVNQTFTGVAIGIR